MFIRSNGHVLHISFQFTITKQISFVIFKSHGIFDQMFSDSLSFDFLYAFDLMCVRLFPECGEFTHSTVICFIGKQHRYYLTRFYEVRIGSRQIGCIHTIKQDSWPANRFINHPSGCGILKNLKQ